MLGVDMPAGYETQIAAVKKYRTEFNAYRDAVAALQKNQLNFAYYLMGLN